MYLAECTRDCFKKSRASSHNRTLLHVVLASKLDHVLQDHIGLLVLVVPQADEDDVALQPSKAVDKVLTTERDVLCCQCVEVVRLAVLTQTFLRILPRMWHNLLMPSMHIASSRPLPSILSTWAYSTATRQR